MSGEKATFNEATGVLLLPLVEARDIADQTERYAAQMLVSPTSDNQSRLVVSSITPVKEPNIAVCHIPSGNPEGAHTIYISMNTYENTHKAHGDTLGECGSSSPDDQGNTGNDGTGTDNTGNDGTDNTGGDGTDNTGNDGTGTDGTDNAGGDDGTGTDGTGTDVEVETEPCLGEILPINPNEETVLNIGDNLIITFSAKSVDKPSTLCIDETTPAGEYASGIYNVRLDEITLSYPVKITLHYDVDFVTNSGFSEDDLTILFDGVDDALSVVDKDNNTVSTFTYNAGEITIGIPASVYDEKYSDTGVELATNNDQISTESSIRSPGTVRQIDNPLCKKFPYEQQITINSDLEKRFNAFLERLSIKAISYGEAEGCRSKKDAHKKSTVFSLFKTLISADTLKSLPRDRNGNGKDKNGNIWYMQEWSDKWVEWCNDQWFELDKQSCVNQRIKEKEAKPYAFEFAEKHFPKIINTRFRGRIKGINYAEEGYPRGDPYRKPNIDQMLVSRHTTGNAIDLGSINWKKLGGPWTEKADKFVGECGLSRPLHETPWNSYSGYSGQTYEDRSKYASAESWHFELPNDQSIKLQSVCMPESLPPAITRVEPTSLAQGATSIWLDIYGSNFFGSPYKYQVDAGAGIVLSSIENLTFKVNSPSHISIFVSVIAPDAKLGFRDIKVIRTNISGSKSETSLTNAINITRCSKKSCNGLNPDTSGCLNRRTIGTAKDIEINGNKFGTIELRHSDTCQTKWARIICKDCDNLIVDVTGKVVRSDYKEYSVKQTKEYSDDSTGAFWSPMLYEPNDCDAYAESTISFGIINKTAVAKKEEGCFVGHPSCPIGQRRGTRSDTECLEEPTPTIGASCGYGKIYDCSTPDPKCVSAKDAQEWQGDGSCDDGEYGIVLTCPYFNNDGGDCDEKPATSTYTPPPPGPFPVAGASCGNGFVYDCILHCVNASYATAWKGDGNCDDGEYGIVLTCSAFNNDGGDCSGSTTPTPEPEPVETPYPPTKITSKDSTSPYATTENLFSAGQGTWYAYGRVIELVAWKYLPTEVGDRIYNAFNGKTDRHSKNWPNFLSGDWIATSVTNPLPKEKRQRGLLAVWSDGTYGHVGFVEEVNADKTKYRLSSFNRFGGESYQNDWYDFEGTNGELSGYYPQFYNLTKPNW